MSDAKLPLRVVLPFAALAAPMAALGLPAFIYISPFYAETVGLSLGALGFVLLLSRLWDMVSDPLVGFLSDKSGQRLPWMVAGVPLVLLGMWAVFTAPFGASAGWLFAALLVYYTGWTCVQVPYTALAAEAHQDSAERTRLITWREGFAALGLIAALILPNVWQREANVALPAHALAVLCVVVTALFLPLIVYFYSVWRRRVVPVSASAAQLKTAWRAIVYDKIFRQLLLAYTFNGLANALPGLLFFFFAGDRLGLDADKTNILLLLYFVAAACGLPLWLGLARRYPKQAVWRGAMLFTCAVFAGALLLPYGAFYGFMAVCVLTGLCLGADMVLPASLQTDLIERAGKASGVSAAGAYMGLWSIATKLAIAAGSVVYPLLELSGYDPQAETHSETALMSLAICYAGIPVLLKLVAIQLTRRIAL